MFKLLSKRKDCAGQIANYRCQVKPARDVRIFGVIGRHVFRTICGMFVQLFACGVVFTILQIHYTNIATNCVFATILEQMREIRAMDQFMSTGD